MRKIVSTFFTLAILFASIPFVAAQESQKASKELFVDPIAYIGPELTKEEQLKALAVPGYFTANEYFSELDVNPQQIQAYVVCDDDMKVHYEQIVGHSVPWDTIFMWA